MKTMTDTTFFDTLLGDAMPDSDNLVTCDACGQVFPASHMADNWLLSDLCVPCDDQIKKDLDGIA